MRVLMTIMLIGAVFSSVLLAGVNTRNLHDKWDDLLKKHVRGGLVNYKAIKKELPVLNGYLDQLDRVDIASFSESERLALYINAYNAYTIKLILNHYPVGSIREIKDPWKTPFCKIGGKRLTLDQIEHDILRKQIKEPRIHFAVVCASIGCPDLQSFAYRGDSIDVQLNTAAKQFFASKKHFIIEPDEEDGRYLIIYFSKIFEWFGGDFGPKAKDWAAFILPYTEGEDYGSLKHAETIVVKYLDFDWHLNEQKK